MKVIKKILLGLLLLVSTISLSQGFTLGNRVLMGGTTIEQGSITLASTSVLNPWAPTIVNTGTTLDWTVSGDLTIAKTTVNSPSFDFSPNTGTANVLIENTNDLTLLWLTSKSITEIDVTEATALEWLVLEDNPLIVLDISTNISLETLAFYDCSITALDISNNPLLTNVGFTGNILPNTVVDQIYINLDNFGLIDGILQHNSTRTSASDTARANLIAKGWTGSGL